MGDIRTLLDCEHLIGLLGDAVDGLESLQASDHPVSGLEDIANTTRFVRAELLRHQAMSLIADAWISPESFCAPLADPTSAKPKKD
jgi:hypothetical protein